jgi:hypothetical protein
MQRGWPERDVPERELNVDRFAGWLHRLTGASVPSSVLHRFGPMASAEDVAARPGLPPLHQVVSVEQIHLLCDQFARSRSQAESLAISHRAITLITTNSGLINGTIREAIVSGQSINFKNAIDYGIQHSPDYGSERNVDRVVDFSPDFLEKILREALLPMRRSPARPPSRWIPMSAGHSGTPCCTSRRDGAPMFPTDRRNRICRSIYCCPALASGSSKVISRTGLTTPTFRIRSP